MTALLLFDDGGGSYKEAYVNAGDAARELRELPAWAEERRDREDDPAELVPEPPPPPPPPLPPPWPLPRRTLTSFLSRVTGPDHSLSVAALLTPESSRRSPEILLPPPLVEAEPETSEKTEELALMSFSFSLIFSSKSMKMRERASLYAASRCSMVRCFLLVAVWLRPPALPASEGSTSERSLSSPLTEPVRDWGLERIRSCGVRRMILNAGCFVASGGTRSARRREGLGRE